MKDILAQGLTQMGITPPPGAVDKLCQYSDLLLEQNKVMNLTAITEPEEVARLHFLDSAAILTWGKETALALAPSGGSTWLSGKSLVDVGTGAGFPGMVLKILDPSLSLTLVDSLGKRVACGVVRAMKSIERHEEVQGGLSAVKRLGGALSDPFDYPIPGGGLSHRIVTVKKLSPTPKGLPRSWGKIKKAPL